MAAKRKSSRPPKSQSRPPAKKSAKKGLGKSGRPLKRLGARKAPREIGSDSQVRLQKFLAAAGIGSRRDCEVLIVEGRIEVDGVVVTELGTRIDPDKADVRFDGEKVRVEKQQYFILNKPPGVVSTSLDPAGRTRVVDLISSHQRVYNVGRLDKSSEGLILVTNDGAVAQYLTHPRYGVEKTYHVQVKGQPQLDDLQLLLQGVHLAEGIAKVKDVEIKRRQKHSTDLKIVLDEGKNREIRRLLAKLGHKVVRLVRVAIGPIQLGSLPQGAFRRLNGDEVKELKKFTDRLGSGSAASQRPKTTSPKATAGKHRTRKNTAVDANDPIQIKIAEGRPIHIEDVEKSREMREAAKRNADGKRKPAAGSGQKPVRFNTRSVGGLGMKKSRSHSKSPTKAGDRTKSGDPRKKTGGNKSRQSGPGPKKRKGSQSSSRPGRGGGNRKRR